MAKVRLPSEQRELAIDVLGSRLEGSFATAFLEAFIRADLTNQAILGKPFDIFADKFAWEEKVIAAKERMEHEAADS